MEGAAAPVDLLDICWLDVFSFLPARQLAEIMPATCQEFRDVCSRFDRELWGTRCRDLCQSQSYRRYRDEASRLTYRERYRSALIDSRRTVLADEELCDQTWALRRMSGGGAAGAYHMRRAQAENRASGTGATFVKGSHLIIL